MVDFLFQVVQAFLPLLAIMDPFISVPTFLLLTRKNSAAKKHEVAFQAVAIAGVLLYLFLFFGLDILKYVGVTLAAMQIGGGLVLFVMGLELVLGLSFPKEKARAVAPAAIVLGTPLITGPGVISTSILFSQQYGVLVTGVAAFFALLVTWVVLRYSHLIERALGPSGSEMLSRIMGLLLVVVAAQFIVAGVKASF